MADPNVTKLLIAVSGLCKILGLLLVAHGLGDSKVYFWVQTVGGSVMIVGPAIWDVWMSIAGFAKARAVGVQAGINLTASGKAVADDGTVISSFSGEGTPPKPVTIATAAQIVKDFGPTAAPAKE